MYVESLERPEAGLRTDATEATGHESMLWDIASENVLEAPAKNMNADTEHERREKKKENGNGDGSYLDRFGMEPGIAAVKRVRIKGFGRNSGGRQTLP